MNGLSAAGDVDVSDVTSDGINADILRQLKNNDPEFTELWVGAGPQRSAHYAIEDARGMGALGHYLGRCTNVAALTIQLPAALNSGIIEPFLSGLERNRSIKKAWLWKSHIPREFFRMLTPFIRDNTNLETFGVRGTEMDAEQYRLLSSALREGRSLKHFFIGGIVDYGYYDHEESIIDNIEALKMHPQLEVLLFRDFSMGRNNCAALSNLLRQLGGLQTLRLDDDCVDDSGVEVLVEGLAHCRNLRELNLSRNPSITVRGWRALAALLEDPNSNLRVLYVSESGINDERATIFANALAHNNSTLTKLDLYDHTGESTGKAWKAFSKVLCDTSSVNSTFLSNHTLQYLYGPGSGALPGALASLLELNRQNDKKEVAIKKILLHHDDFDMQPLFEWDLKVLPVVIEWLERAAAYEIEYEADNRNRKLAAIYQFMRGMPELVIEGITEANKKSAQTVGKKRSYAAACE